MKLMTNGVWNIDGEIYKRNKIMIALLFGNKQNAIMMLEKEYNEEQIDEMNKLLHPSTNKASYSHKVMQELFGNEIVRILFCGINRVPNDKYFTEKASNGMNKVYDKLNSMPTAKQGRYFHFFDLKIVKEIKEQVPKTV